jgi:hypothetical protein
MKKAAAAVVGILMALAMTGAGAPPASPPAAAGFRILTDVALPKAFEWASDVRWASDKSVYLAASIDGTFEVSLDPSRPTPKEMIPGRSKPGGFLASQRVAASSQFLVAAGPGLSLTWRRLDDPARVEEPFDIIKGIDVQENRLAVLGARRDEDGKFGTDGAIAWTGALERKHELLRPILYDVTGPGARTLSRCSAFPLGAVRFLPNGSLVVVPGVQPGVNLFDKSGKLVRTWDSSAVGIDADCQGLTDQQGWYLDGHALERQAWLNQRHILNAVLPFAQGPGLVVRTVAQGRTHWALKLLRLDGSVQNLEIPLEGNNESFYLAGDLRAGKIVFLLYESLSRGGGKTHPTPPRLIVANLPEGLAN